MHLCSVIILSSDYYSCVVSRMSYKMGSVSLFWCRICACKFILAYIYHALFRVGGGGGRGRGLFEIFSSTCKNSFVVLGKCVKDFKKVTCLKMYVTMKYQFILRDKDIVRVTSNQPSIPCFKPINT